MAKTPREAYERYHDALMIPIRCLTSAHVVNNKHAEAGTEIFFAFSNNPVDLLGSPYSLFLLQRVKVIPHPRIEGEWKVKTLGYEYAIELTKEKKEVIAFHWNSSVDNGLRAHIHVGLTGKGQSLSNKHHIPSGRVSVENVVKFLIEELRVPPAKAYRGTWNDLIEKALQKFNAFRSW